MLAAARRSAADGQTRVTRCGRRGTAPVCSGAGWRASERGGPAGAQADRDLDAVTALFDVTEQYVSRTAGASLRGLVDHVEAMGLPAAPRDQRPEPDAVTVLSAHAALGREWDVVVIAGLQEGLWPNTIPRGGVLGTQQLVDVLDGVARSPTVDCRAGAAAGRGAQAADRRDGPRPQPAAGDRGRQRQRRRVDAAVAVLLRARGPGDRSRSRPARAGPRAAGAGSARGGRPAARGGVRTAGRGRRRGAGLCGNAIGAAGAGRCRRAPTRPVVRHDAADHRRTAVERRRPRRHAVAVDAADADRLPAALAARTPRRHRRDAMCARRSVRWCTPWSPSRARPRARCSTNSKRSGATAVRVAVVRGQRAGAASGDAVDVRAVAGADPSRAHRGRHGGRRRRRRSRRAPAVRVRGRLDRLERDGAGRLVVVDIKTGKTPVSKDDAQRHAQLAMYQLAIAEGLLPQGDRPGAAGWSTSARPERAAPPSASRTR